VRTHKSLSLIAAGAMFVTGFALAGGPALADPVNSHLKSVLPRDYDIVGVGADTDDTLLDQLAFDYDKTHKVHNASHPYIYSFDATPPNSPTDLTSDIRPKAGCSSKTPRPDGTGAGISAFEANAKTRGYDCIDFARSSSNRLTSGDTLPKGPTGDLYVRLAEDAETYAYGPKGNVPANLTYADLKGIFGCTITNWDQLPGDTTNATIDPLLPPTTAGVTKFWLKALGLSSTPASCVDLTDTVTIQQNEGVDAIFSGPDAANVLIPFSVGKYIAQADHSAKPGKRPARSQNTFGRDEHGHLVLGSIDGQAPTTGTGARTTINAKGFAKAGAGAFMRPLYDIVWYATKSINGDHIPGRLEPFFAAAIGVRVKGWFCSNKTAKQAIEDYGFLVSPECGFTS
jgi:ABC-type phosphate transport system substrate-binding protein